MPVDSTHADYDNWIYVWRRCRSAVAGEDAIHARGELELPRLSEQTDSEYSAYKLRAHYLNATGRTLDGLTGMIFRKEPNVEAPGMEGFLDDINQEGSSFQAFAETVTDEVIAIGRYGVLVDFPALDNSERLTMADAAALGFRPFVQGYRAENILDWRVEHRGSGTVLTQVRLLESADVEEDEFSSNVVEQIRVLEMADEGYRQRLFRKNKEGEWKEFFVVEPLQQGKRLDHIPFYFFGPKGGQWHISKPPLLDLINTNLSHYRLNADYRHGLHFVSLPTPYIFGIDEEETPQSLGPTGLWVSANEQAKAGMLEYSGAGLDSVRQALLDLRNDMASLGARMLLDDKRRMETAETAQIHRTGESSVLASIANAISLQFTSVLEEARDWMGLRGDVSVELNRDYFPSSMSPQMLGALLQAVQGGQISQETFFYQLQQGEIIRPGKSFDEEQSEIQTTSPF